MVVFESVDLVGFFYPRPGLTLTLVVFEYIEEMEKSAAGNSLTLTLVVFEYSILILR